jgi:hypothetical protein
MQLCIPFFKAFAGVFTSPEHHEVIVAFFTNVLERAPADWRYTTEFMFGRYLLESPHGLSNAQFAPLADVFIQTYFSSDHNDFHLAENLGYLMIQKKLRGEISPLAAFNLVRSRASLKRNPINPTSLAPAQPANSTSTEQEDTDEVRDATELMQRHVFPILTSMNTEPRTIERVAHNASDRILNIPIAQTVLTPNIGAAVIATDALTSSKLLDPALISGLHTALPIVLSDSAPPSVANSKVPSVQNSQPSTPKQTARRAQFRDLPTFVPTTTQNHVAQDEAEEAPIAKVVVNPFGDESESTVDEPTKSAPVAENPFGSDAPAEEVPVENGEVHPEVAPPAAINPFDAPVEENENVATPTEEFKTPRAEEEDVAAESGSSNPFA